MKIGIALSIFAVCVQVAIAQQVPPAGAAPTGAAPTGAAQPQVQPAPPVPDSIKVESVWDFLVKGGPVMIPIGICSLVALTVIVERLLSLRRRQIIPANFFGGLREILKTTDDRARALDYCKSRPSPAANILIAGIKKLNEPVAILEKHIQDAGEREILRMRKYLRWLSVIASVAPLLGLLGTITGMITAFQTVAASGEALGRTELLAKGIYEAMITTAAGLIVAIPVLIAYHGLTARVDLLVTEMDQSIVDLLEDIRQPETASAPRTAMAIPAIVDRGQDGRMPAAGVVPAV